MNRFGGVNQQQQYAMQQQYLQQQQQMSAQQQMLYNQQMQMQMDMEYDDEEYYDEEDGSNESPQQQYYDPNTGALQDSSGGFIEGLEGFEILEEELDEDYDPTMQEIEDYAKYLGMDLQEDRDLFYIAKEGLKAPLPDEWKPCKSPGGSIHYVNLVSKQRQTDHPCDDYYRQNYRNTKATQIRKQEEKAVQREIKKQQKEMQQQQMQQMQIQQINQQQQQQQQQAIMGASHGSASISMSMGASKTGASKLSQMVLQAPAAAAFDVSNSAVDELVFMKLDQIQEEHEEKKIVYERQKTKELNQIKEQNSDELDRIRDEAQEQIEEIQQRAQTDAIRDGTLNEAHRKAELEQDKHERLKKTRQDHDKQTQKATQQMSKEQQEILKMYKNESESRHKFAVDSLKNAMLAKLDLERDKMFSESNQLIEESGDIDHQVRLFRDEMHTRQIKQEENKLDDELRDRIQQIKDEHHQYIRAQVDKIQNEQEQKLGREKEKEAIKHRVDYSKINNLKDQAKSEMQTRHKDQQRQLERETQEKIRNQRTQIDKDQDRDRQLLRQQTKEKFERKESQLDDEKQYHKEALKSQIKQHEDDKQQEFQRQKSRIAQELEDKWNEEKEVYLQQENESNAGYQQIIENIQQGKNMVEGLNLKFQDLERELRRENMDVEDLENERLQKEKELRYIRANPQKSSAQMEVELLEKELIQSNEEHARLNNKVREARVTRDMKSQKTAVEDIGHTKKYHDWEAHESAMRYTALQAEVDSLKVELIKLKNSRIPSTSDLIPRSDLLIKEKTANDYIPLDYTQEEILTQIESDLPLIKQKRKKLENDRIMIRQLISNVQRNKLKYQKDLVEAEKSSSLHKKMALQSVKDKLDSEEMSLKEQEKDFKDRCDDAKRQEEMIKKIQDKVDKIDEQTDQDRKNGLFKELQNDFDRYLRKYERTNNKYKRQRKTQKAREDELATFQSKWAQLLCDETVQESEELRPMLGLDQDPTSLSYFNPKPSHYSLSNRYESSSAIHRAKTSYNLMHQKEMDKIRRDRHQVQNFIFDQQKWLTKLKTDLKCY